MPVWGKWILGFVWDKLAPVVVDWVKNTFRKAEINKEVQEETDEIKKIKSEIRIWQEDNDSKEIPEHLKAKLLDASRRRVRGLQ